MGKKSSIFQSLYAKWSSKKDNVVEQRTVVIIFLVLLTIFSSLSIRFFKLTSDANSVCPFPVETDNIHGQIVLVPTSSENIFDCSSRDITIASDGEVIVEGFVNLDGTMSADYGAEILFRNLTIEHGGKFLANGKGYRPSDVDGGVSNGESSTDNTDASGGSGGGFGGAGGEGVSDGLHPPGTPGIAHDIAQEPISLGGAGANSGNGGNGGYGGGAIKLVISEDLNLYGIISANGLQGTLSTDNISSGGGGAGGSVWIEAGSFTGNGQVTANGGGSTNAGYQGGGGGGGRIQMFCNVINYFTGTTSVLGGATEHSQDGGAGSVLGPTCRPNTPTILKQYKLNLTTEVPIGGATAEESFYLAGNLSDSDISDALYLEVEVRAIGNSFTNQVTHSQSSGFSNPKNCDGTGTTCGRINVTGLTRSTQYHWQARVRDDKGGVSSWISYGENLEDQTDILLSGQAALILSLQGDAQAGIVDTILPIKQGVKVLDINGLAVAGYTVNWSVIDGSNGGLFTESTSTETNSSGEATISYRLGKNTGTNTTRATTAGLVGSPVSFTSTGNPDVIHHFTVIAPDAVLINSGFNVTISAYDQFNNIKNDFAETVNLSSVDPLDVGQTLNGNLNPSTVDFVLGDYGTLIVNLSYDTIDSIKIKAENSGAVGYSSTIAVVLELGSCPDADGIIDTSQNWIADTVNNGIFDCRGLNIHIISNAVLTLTPYDNNNTNYTDDFGVTVLTDNLTIDFGSSINANGLGYRNTKGPGSSGSSGDGAPGGSYGGFGNNGNRSSSSPYGDVYNPIDLGSGGVNGNMTYNRYGGNGGGAIKLVSTDTILNNGSISVNGTDGRESGGGASGGSIWLSSVKLNGNGTLSANGGQGGGSWGNGGGGAGGRIAIFYTSGDFPVNDTNIVMARGSWGGWGYGGPGTVYIENSILHSANQGSINIDNNSQNYMSAGLIEATYHFSEITLTRNGNLTILGNNSVLDIYTSEELNGDSTIPDLTVEGTINSPDDLNIIGLDLGIKGARTGLVNLNIGDVSTPGGLTIYEKTWAHQDTSGHFVFGNVALSNASNLSFKYASVSVDYFSPAKVEFNNLIIEDTSIAYVDSQDNGDSDWTNDYGFEIYASNIILGTNAVIESSARGYANTRGPGVGPSGGGSGLGNGGPGGSYGGFGGNGTGSRYSADPNGSLYEPLSLGSGGGNGNMTYNWYAGVGGGAVKIVVLDTFDHNGEIRANGSNGNYDAGAGGSGGSIWIDAGLLNGNGSIIANGGVGGSAWGGAGGGSGGRVAIYYIDGNYPVEDMDNVIVRGSYGGLASGGPGTVYLEQRGVDSPQVGRVFVDNNGLNSRSAGLVEGTYFLRKINLTRYGHLTALGENCILNVTESSSLTGDTTIPELTVEGTINLPGSVSINGLSLGVKGAHTGMSNIELGIGGIQGGLVLYEKTWAHRSYDDYFRFNDVNIGANSRMTVRYGDEVMDYGKPVKVEFSNLIMGSGTVATLYGQEDWDSNWNDDYGVELRINGNMTMAATALIDSSGLGYINTRGPGAGPESGGSGLGNGGPGGSYGGFGANGNTARYSANPNGSLYEPLTLGSGGANGNMTYNWYAGKGGGSIKVVVGNIFENNGEIRSNGSNGNNDAGAGGSGGSIWVDAGILNGTGSIVANGGVGGYAWGGAGGGSGGRVAIYYIDGNYPIENPDKVMARGSAGGLGNGGPGTIYLEQRGVDDSHAGRVFVDNNNLSGRSAGLVEDTYTLKKINLTRYGHLTALGVDGVVNITESSALTGDSTIPELTIEGTINLPESVSINGLSLGVKGAHSGMNNIDIGISGIQGGLVLYEKTWAHKIYDDHFNFNIVNLGENSRMTVRYGNEVVDYGKPVKVEFNMFSMSAGSIATLYGQDDGDADWGDDYGVELLVNGNMNVYSNALINSTGLGYVNTRGPGAGSESGGSGLGNGGPGGSYGGFGANGNTARYAAEPYGSLYEPQMLGSGGGNGNMTYNWYAGNGGGAIKITVTGTLLNNGEIRSNGTNGNNDAGAGGSGGSIWVDASTLNGSGTIVANGGVGGYAWGGAGGGSGGRIAIYYSNGSYPIENMDKVMARGANGLLGNGGPGTIYLEQRGVDNSQAGRVLADNNNLNGRSAGIVEGAYTLKKIQLTRLGHLIAMGQYGVLDVTESSSLRGDSSIPELTIEGTINLPSYVTINGLSLGIKGAHSGMSDIDLGVGSTTGGLVLYEKTWAHNNWDNHFVFGNVNMGNNSRFTVRYGNEIVDYGKPVNIQFNNLTMASGSLATLYAQDDGDNDWSDDYGVELTVNTNMSMATTAVIDATGLGYVNTRGPGAGPESGGSGLGNGGPGGSYGGYGANGNTARYAAAPYGNLFEPISLGSGGGNGNMTYNWYAGNGGGAIKVVVAGTFENNGTIRSNGSNGNNDAGAGGSGGSIWIDAGVLNGVGSVIANGGVGGYAWGGAGGGGGGRVAVYYSSGNFQVSNVAKVMARGSAGLLGYGGPGTVYYKQTNESGSLRIENNNIAGRTQDLDPLTFTLKDLYIGNNVLVYIHGDTSQNRGIRFVLSGDFYLGTGARMDSVGQGFTSDMGPGAGEAGINLGGGGGGANGGSGGAGQSDGGSPSQGGHSYNTENQMQPYMLGSGGGQSGVGALGGEGGGAIAIDARYGNLDIFGTIDVSGTDGHTSSPGGGGGAGGSLLLIGSSCFISGNLIADGGNGGDSNYDGGGGGGGRASILLTSPLENCYILSATISVEFGTSSEGEVGQVGTYVGVATLPQISLNSQNKIDGELIPVGGMIDDNQLKFIVEISDPGADQNNPKRLIVDFEIIDYDQSFITGMTNLEKLSNVLNASSGDTNGRVAGLSTISTSIQTVVNNNPIPVTMQISSGLTAGQGYKWRARVRDVTLGTASAWVDYGNNGDLADFIISTMTGFEVIPSSNYIPVGNAIDLAIRATDNLSNTIVDYIGTGIFSSDPTVNPDASLPSNYTFSVSDHGSHTFVNELIFYVPGIYTVTVEDNLNSSLRGVSEAITVYSPTTPTPSTSNVYTSTPTITTNIESCITNPNQSKCQIDVLITNITSNVNVEELSAEVCWETNVATIGSVTYGESILSRSTTLETQYKTTHCADLTGLKPDTGYNFKISATSIAGRNAVATGTFVVGSGTVPEAPENCITFDQYSFNAENQLLLNYNTVYPAMCSVSYTYLGNEALLAVDIEKLFMMSHLSKLNLNGLFKDRDIAYGIDCYLNIESNNTINTLRCQLEGSVPKKKVEVYIPPTPTDITIVGKVAPVVTIPLIFGLFWFRRKPQKGAWGLVYDGIDRKPIPFAVLRLYDASNNRLLKEEVTSIDGKYNFLVGAGNYNLVAEHSLYNPLQKEIVIKDKKTEIAEEMPLNKRTSKKTIRPHGLWKNLGLLFIKYNNYIVLIGFIFSIVATIFSFIWFNLIVLALYAIQEIILYMDKGIVWARVVDKDTQEPIPGAFVRLFDVLEKRQLEVTLTDNMGRYKFLTKDGKYMAIAYQTGYYMSPSPDEVKGGGGQRLVWINIKKGITKDDVYLTRSP